MCINSAHLVLLRIMSIIKEAVIIYIKIVIAVILVTPKNPEIQEYFQDYFLLFSKIHYVTLESSKCIVPRGEKRGLSTEDLKTSIICCSKIILKTLYDYFGNYLIQLSNIRLYSSS